MKSSREQFEEWAKSKWDNELGDVLSDGNYAFEPIQLQWEGWQASRAAIEVTLPDCDDYQLTWQYQDAAEIKIKEMGLTVK